MKLAYVAFDGNGKQVQGQIEAATEAEARANLRNRQLYVTEMDVTDAGEPLAAAPAGEPAQAIGRIGTTKKLRHLVTFARQLNVLLNSGTQLVDALSALERQSSDPKWRAVVHRVRWEVEQGASLTEAVEVHPKVFDPILQSMIAAGESGGNLGAMLERMATLLQRRLQTRKTVMGALIYPSVLITLALGVISVMLLFVVPRFGELFETLDAPLPGTTKVMLDISKVFRGYWYVIVGVLASGIVGVKLALGSPAGKRFVDRMLVRLPKIGTITRSFATARILRLLGVLLDSQVPLVDALQLTRRGTGNLCYSELIAEAEEAVVRGEPVSSVMRETPLITPSIYQAMRAGEASGQVAPLLLQLADHLDEENEVVLRSLTSIIEPVILILMGLLVGLVAMSMFMPLFDMTTMTAGG